MKIIYKITVIILLGILSCKGKVNSKDHPDISSHAELEFEKITLTSLDNRPIDVKQYEGKAIFINFWATWCKPCLLEMPSIQKAQDILKKEDIIFLFASDEESDQIAAFKNENEYNFNYVRVENLEGLNITALPTTFIFNPDGKLVFNEMGYRQWDDKNNIDLILSIVKSK